ncbi:MAG TPA: DUF5916 domain-containing protein [Longimicrobiales bacterium]|nr:DUF5916 domain-containing protein [Longimicrobiales bacterium]
MKLVPILIAVLPAVLASAVEAQTPLPGELVDTARSASGHWAMPAITAVRLNSGIRIDGRLDEADWATAAPATGFTQMDPAEGQPASERTEVRVMYDDEALYIGARMWDATGDVRQRLGRRDANVEGSDFLYVMIDSHHDHITAYQFSVNPAGVKRDEINSGGNNDTSWDAVWDLGTETLSDGWVAELRIPFSQLRFPARDDQTWGIQVQRRIVRNQELSVFAFTPKRERGGVARYGHLRGLQGLKPGKRVEALPYTVARATFNNIDASNPFARETEQFAVLGVDLKYRLTSSLKLYGTVNPDFGQVELDPAVVNLSAFETSFQEKRPFFVEGADIFRVGETRLFYSRRIGRPPQGGLPDGTQYADRPEASTILAAAKLSGKTANGWSLGFLEAVTAREHARFELETGERGKAVVEPYTNYLVARAKRDFRSGQSTVGLIGTAVNRNLETPALRDLLRSSAYVTGLDFSHEFQNRTWSANGFLALSHVLGSPAALLRTQRSSARYFQRPDADYVSLDSAATSLSGYAFRFEVGKRAGLHWRGEANVAASSPGYEINDAGFQTSVDRFSVGGNLTYIENRPGEIFRDWRISTSPQGEWNHGREFQGGRVNLELSGQLLNYWRGELNLQYGLAGYDDRLTRGGPSARELAGRHIGWELNSDNRRRVSARTRGNYSWSESGGWHRQIGGGLTLRPAENWSISVGPTWNVSRTAAQYLTTVTDTFARATFGSRYLFAPIRQNTVSMETRLNVNFAPHVSLDVYAQPFVSSGDFGLPMELARPRSFAFNQFSSSNGTLVTHDAGYTIDPDAGGPAPSFDISDRDFNARSLRGNAVLRWEWRPGSTVFLVWQQRRETDFRTGRFQLHRELRNMFGAKPENVFLIKASYWFNP